MSKGYTCPLILNRPMQITQLAICLLGSGFCVWLAWTEWADGFRGGLVMLIPAVMMLVDAVNLGLQLFAQLHLVPEGIAITLGRKTVGLYPAETIGLLCGVIHYSKSTQTPLLAVCKDTAAGIAARREAQLRRNPYYRGNIPYRKRRADWQEKFISEYMTRRVIAYGFTLRRDILWLDWSAERLAVLQELYPHTTWVDTSDKKEFNAQL